MRRMSKSAMDRAVDEAVRKEGSRAKVAKRLGISRQAMEQWERVPPRHVLALEAMSGVSRYVIRPDIYGRPAARSSAERRVA
jgi:DNA-binding transcriptional regulator YdaS (Cro superfamily)